MSDDIHEVYAIRYGHHAHGLGEFHRRRSARRAPAARLFRLGDRRAARRHHRRYRLRRGDGQEAPARSCSSRCARGLGARHRSEKVETVIISHMHYDHCRQLRSVSARALSPAGLRDGLRHRPLHVPRDLRMPFEADYVVAMVRKVFAGRVTFHDGADEIAPGVTVHHIGGHAKGLQSVRVKTRRGPVVLAADATHSTRIWRRAACFPITYNVAEVLEGYDTLQEACALAAPRRARPRSAGACALSGGQSRPGRLGGAARCRAAGCDTAKCPLPRHAAPPSLARTRPQAEPISRGNTRPPTLIPVSG